MAQVIDINERLAQRKGIRLVRTANPGQYRMEIPKRATVRDLDGWARALGWRFRSTQKGRFEAVNAANDWQPDGAA